MYEMVTQPCHQVCDTCIIAEDSTMALDPLTQRITRRIAEAIGPKQIYLFGSRLRGDATSDSD
jgi:predicted nucleotidyltransferase